MLDFGNAILSPDCLPSGCSARVLVQGARWPAPGSAEALVRLLAPAESACPALLAVQGPGVPEDKQDGSSQFLAVGAIRVAVSMALEQKARTTSPFLSPSLQPPGSGPRCQ